MDKARYESLLESLVAEGLGYQAIADLAKLMKTYSDNREMVIREMEAEKKAVMKILASPKATVRSKLLAVKNLFE